MRKEKRKREKNRTGLVNTDSMDAIVGVVTGLEVSSKKVHENKLFVPERHNRSKWVIYGDTGQ